MNQQTKNVRTKGEPSPIDKMIIQSLARLDSIALGVSVGSVLGLLIFTATIILVYKGGEQVGPRLALLNQYFIGYEVTAFGSLIGLFYGFITGFVLGWLSSAFRNFIFRIYLYYYKLRRNVSGITEFIDNP